MVRVFAAVLLAASAAAQSYRYVTDEFKHLGFACVSPRSAPRARAAAARRRPARHRQPAPRRAAPRRAAFPLPPALRSTERSALVRFSCALPMSGVEELEARVLAAADPRSAAYGAWMSQAEVAALVAPPAALRAEVRAWATATGARCIDMPSSLRCEATVAQAEALLGARLSAFAQAPSGRVVHRLHPDTDYVWPEHLDGKMLFITGLADFPTARRRAGALQAITVDDQGRAAATDYAVLLETLGDFYNTAGVTGSMASKTAPAEFQARERGAGMEQGAGAALSHAFLASFYNNPVTLVPGTHPYGKTPLSPSCPPSLFFRRATHATTRRTSRRWPPPTASRCGTSPRWPAPVSGVGGGLCAREQRARAHVESGVPIAITSAGNRFPPRNPSLFFRYW